MVIFLWVFIELESKSTVSQQQEREIAVLLKKNLLNIIQKTK